MRNRDRDPQRVAIVGCAEEKLDLSGDKGPVTIARLYTSNYFVLKREYAKECCDEYMILSAKHGLVMPGYYVTDDYDLSIDDLDGAELSNWVAEVREELHLIEQHHPEDTLVMLAGQSYLDPLADVLQSLHNDVEYPFDDTAGIGEQMGWLREKIDAAQAESPADRDDHDDGQTGIGRWADS